MTELKDLSAFDALYLFCGWLTTRKEKTIMSSSDDCANIARLIKEFCDKHNINEEK